MDVKHLADYPRYDAHYPTAAKAVESSKGWFCVVSYPADGREVIASYGPYATLEHAMHVAVSAFGIN